MSVKRYEANGSSSVSEDANGSLVDYSDYAALQQKLAASQREFRAADATIENLQMQVEKLAAENAGLKSVIEYCINPDNQPEYHDQGMGCGVEDRGYQRDGYSACYYGWESAIERVYSEVIPDAIPETPATDAFLAEVRAQGLERLAKAWYAIANETSPGISISESSRLKYRQRADDVADFANEIRKEAAQ
ncbi:hypothetical protein [Enterobacter wuhouensis]|uniref:hypothetical protein n=1 Tax=Enterobacter wuhouensis TaxID=2529381 RepID=UPI001F613522|nr:hypothetical protein [Enterobacter wuhouensis]